MCQLLSGEESAPFIHEIKFASSHSESIIHWVGVVMALETRVEKWFQRNVDPDE